MNFATEQTLIFITCCSIADARNKNQRLFSCKIHSLCLSFCHFGVGQVNTTWNNELVGSRSYVEQTSKIWCKNIHLFLRNCGFRVRAFYFDALCILIRVYKPGCIKCLLSSTIRPADNRNTAMMRPFNLPHSYFILASSRKRQQYGQDDSPIVLLHRTIVWQSCKNRNRLFWPIVCPMSVSTDHFHVELDTILYKIFVTVFLIKTFQFLVSCLHSYVKTYFCGLPESGTLKLLHRYIA